jgi:hypothetical protein
LVKFQHILSVVVVLIGNGFKKSEVSFIPVSALLCLDLNRTLAIKPIGCNSLSIQADRE